MLEALEPRLLLAGEIALTAVPGQALDLTARLNTATQTIDIIDNQTNTVAASQALSDFGPTNRVLVTGNDQNDHLTVDYTAGGAFAVPVSFDGGTHGAGGDTLRVVGTDNLWDLAGGASGTVGQVSFAGVENVTGGSGADTFHIAAVPPGSVTGGGGHDVLDFTNAGSPMSVVLEDATPEGFSGSGTVTFAEIDGVVGSGALTDALADQTGMLTALWDLDADPTYSNGAQTLEFTAFEQLTGGSGADTFSVSGAQTATLGGGAGADTFQFSNGAVLTGGIEGGADPDTLDYAAATTARQVTLSGLGSVDGFAGTEAALSGGFTNIDALVGGTGSDTLTGLNAAATWDVDGSNRYGARTASILQASRPWWAAVQRTRFRSAGHRRPRCVAVSGPTCSNSVLVRC